MASGKTLDLISFSRQMRYRKTEREVTKFRRRTLNGKARVRERKEARRIQKAEESAGE
jgi:thymidine kinase